MANDPLALGTQQIENANKLVRGQRVLLDAELARHYGVTTSALNQAVKRNSARFPADFAFQLTRAEFADLISQSMTSKAKHGGRRKRPWAFTEHGVAMLSRVLRSTPAARVNVESCALLFGCDGCWRRPANSWNNSPGWRNPCSYPMRKSKPSPKCCAR